MTLLTIVKYIGRFFFKFLTFSDYLSFTDLYRTALAIDLNTRFISHILNDLLDLNEKMSYSNLGMLIQTSTFYDVGKWYYIPRIQRVKKNSDLNYNLILQILL